MDAERRHIRLVDRRSDPACRSLRTSGRRSKGAVLDLRLHDGRLSSRSTDLVSTEQTVSNYAADYLDLPTQSELVRDRMARLSDVGWSFSRRPNRRANRHVGWTRRITVSLAEDPRLLVPQALVDVVQALTSLGGSGTCTEVAAKLEWPLAKAELWLTCLGREGLVDVAEEAFADGEVVFRVSLR